MQSVRQTSILEKIYSKKAKNAFFAFFLACLFFFSVRYGYGIIDGPKFFWLMAIMAVYMLLDPECRTRVFDFRFYMLTVAYFLLGNYQHMFLTGESETYNILPYAWTVPTVYILGRLIVGNKKSEIEHRTFTVLAVIAAGMYIQGLLNYLGYFFYSIDYLNYKGIYSESKWRSFWNAAADGTRNNWNNGFLLTISAMFFATLMFKRNKKIFMSIVFFSIVSVAINLVFSGRFLVVIVALDYFIMLLLYIIANHKMISCKVKRLLLALFSLILVIAGVLYYAFKHNIYGLADFYNNTYYLSRGGGVIENVRLRMWYLGIQRAFTLQKGGWNLSDVNYLDTTHNSWIEFARYYDIIIFSLLSIFVVSVLYRSSRTLFKYGYKYKTLYFAVSAVIIMFIYSMVEPIYILNQDLFLFFYFVCGIVSGIEHLAQSPDYGIIGQAYTPNKSRYAVVGLALLSTVLITCAYADWWNDRMNLLLPIAVPVVAYLLGAELKNRKYQMLLFVMVTFATTVAAICMYIKSAKTEYFQYGIYTELVTNNTVDKSVFLALLIFVVAVVGGSLLYFTKLNKVVSALVVTVITGIAMLPRIKDERMFGIKEALHLQLNMKSGLQWIASKENYYNLRTSNSMWLDFARDYGMVIFGLLVVFELWSIYCFIRLLLKQERELIDYWLIVAFVLFNFHFMFEASAITSKYIFALGLMVYGMITSNIDTIIALKYGIMHRGNDSRAS